ncbi:MAG: (2Fe-2S)-binding protein [Nitratireductor sp.]|nr:(2Fe-2S)-binding protein [Nitratireductor sp.]
MTPLLQNHRSPVQRAPMVSFTFEGEALSAHAGETVLSALIRAVHLYLRDAPEDGAARGAFCCMGLCQECLVLVEGRRVESCRQVVHDGLAVEALKRVPHD